ncbi:uncharacterized protein LOC121373286 [Gigantopelta aegis]|uniref:uncharacterized protein LOC121373286 n=1 Tax=Gigantopelta aegis TaxID=1735272 RepID=UPI001B889C81|nr:uncharacterized protein LOC121373286 [Gigantopelta aegis]
MMATLRGTVFTVCDLVFHPTPHRCSTQLACLCVRLYHHGNSSGRRPQAVVDAINVQAHRKSKRMDAKIQYSDVISQLNDILRGGQTGLTARDSLGSRLGTLESLGCSMSDVQEYPQILRLTETEVIKRAQRLKRLGVDPITVETLRVARFKLDKTVAKKLQLSDSGIVQKIIKPKITVARSFGKLLQCTPEECQTMQVRNPSFTLSKNHPVIEKKVNCYRNMASLQISSTEIPAFSGRV